MNYQIDQSGKVEDTAKMTVLAAANDERHAIFITARDKRRLQETFRSIGAPRLFVEYVFSALLVILLRRCTHPVVTVDLEYPKSTRVIESLIGPFTKTEIRWSNIGKRSAAHDTAYKVYVGKLPIGIRVSMKEVWTIVRVSGVFVKEKTGGRLKTGLSPANRRSAPVSELNVPPDHLHVKKSKSMSRRKP